MSDDWTNFCCRSFSWIGSGGGVDFVVVDGCGGTDLAVDFEAFPFALEAFGLGAAGFGFSLGLSLTGPDEEKRSSASEGLMGSAGAPSSSSSSQRSETKGFVKVEASCSFKETKGGGT